MHAHPTLRTHARMHACTHVHLSADHFRILDKQVVNYASTVCEKLLE